MKQLDRFSMDHHAPVKPSQLHGDLNRLVDQSNANFVDHAQQLTAANKTIAVHTETIASLLARIAKLENA
jgi:hypothetical protein